MTEQTHYRDGDVYLYKRPNVDIWQARLRLATGKWKQISTKHKNLDAAAKMACDEYDNIRFRVRNNLQPTTRRMSAVCELVIADIEEKETLGTALASHILYKGLINKWIIPFFGNMNVDSIGPKNMKEWATWRTKENKGKKLKASSIHKQNTALDLVFTFAIEQGWLKEFQRPTATNDGAKGLVRPSFALAEYHPVIGGLATFAKTGRSSHTRHIRALLRSYVCFLFNTGIRPGEEMDSIRWRDIEIYKAPDGFDYTRVYVNRGKTGARELIARLVVQQYLIRWRRYVTKTIGREPLPDELVWRLPDQSQAKDLGGAFELFLISANLLHDRAGKKRVLYSCRHSYATWQIVYRNIDYPTLASNMGTSIAMLEQYYSHLTPTLRARQLAGRRVA